MAVNESRKQNIVERDTTPTNSTSTVGQPDNASQLSSKHEDSSKDKKKSNATGIMTSNNDSHNPRRRSHSLNFYGKKRHKIFFDFPRKCSSSKKMKSSYNEQNTQQDYEKTHKLDQSSKSLLAYMEKENGEGNSDSQETIKYPHNIIHNDPSFGDAHSLIEVQDEIQDYLDTSLNSIQWRVSNLYVEPGDSSFVFWFMLSSYFPLLCGCIGPLSNMMSIFAIVCSWKIRKGLPNDSGDNEGGDEFWVYLVNATSVALALVSNFFLLLNFRKKVRYVVSQVISISGWFIASTMLMCLVIVYHWYFYSHHLDDQFDLNYGFYFAIVTVCLHWLNFVVLFLNELGFLLKKYRPVFNINQVQRSLIFQSSSMAVWLLVGAIISIRVWDSSFGFGLYYCIISVVTIGEQQDIPATSLARGISSFWILIALVLFGLIISSVIDTVLEFSKTTIYWHRLASTKKMKMKLKKEAMKTDKEAFDFMRDVNSTAELTQQLISFLTNSVAFCAFLLLGCTAFKYTEDWSFSTSCYFCFCCLVTLGAGNIIPTSAAGRVLFSVWALAAIPIMTILVSNLSDLIFYRLKKLDDMDMFDIIYRFANGRKHLRFMTKLFRANQDSVDIKTLENLMHDTSISTSKTLMHSLPKVREQINSDAYNIDDRCKSSEDLDELAQAINEFSTMGEFASTRSENAKKDAPCSDGSEQSGNFELYGVSNEPSTKKETQISVPLATNPVDALFEFIFNNTKLSNLSFLNTDSFVHSVKMSIHLLNYVREGTLCVSYDVEKIKRARVYLIRAFRIIDPNFDEDTFLRKYELSSDGATAVIPQDDYILDLTIDKPIDIVNRHQSVIFPPGKSIHTLFRKKHDFILNHLSTLQILLAELHKAFIMVRFKPTFHYNFEEWRRFLILTENSAYVNQSRKGEFWLGDRSPLSFPNREPEYFATSYLRLLESKLHRFAWEYDQDKYHLVIDEEDK